MILTHAHWDHVGGLAAFTGPGTRVIAQARFADELRIVNETGVPFRYFFGGEGPRRFLHDNVLPASLQEHPVAVVPYLVMREHFIRRIHHQRTGYWQPDGENLEALAPREWAAALDVLAGGRESAFVRSAETLLARGDALLALKLSEHGLLTHPESDALPTLRRRALDALRARHQALDPFKFIIYSEQAGAALPPAE